ncbi:DNA translocase FtsK 4TM domain-containing protein [Candidatus Parcubacteria bacterium]|nr:DNA translocase FtsK 4TM domain-containing protein [Candidatus Parcubacteria bacterium]
MARRKKTKTVPYISWKPELSPEVSQEILAIVFLALAVLLMLATLNLGGSLVSLLFDLLRQALGFGAYILPVILLMLGVMLFLPDRYEVGAGNYFGFSGFLLALAGLFHIGIDPASAFDLARDGMGGGFSGFGIAKGLLMILNVPAGAVLLVALLGISLMMATGTRLSDLFRGLVGLVRRDRGEAEITINEPIAAANNRLPIKGTIGGEAARGAKPERGEEALVASHDLDWVPPSFSLLQETTSKPDAGNIKGNAATIEQTLDSFGIDVAMGEVNVGPTVTQYTFKPPSGVKLTKITGLDHNLALSLAAHPIRIEAPIPGKSAVGIEIPNKTAMTVRLRDILTSPEITAMKSPLTFVLGRDVAGQPAAADLARMPHMLIAGATGSGKSVMINSLLTSLLYRNSPSDLKMILVDPKRVELSLYNGIPHLLAPVIVEPEKCISALKWAVAEMERRYKLFAEVGKRNITEYNAGQPKKKAGAKDQALEPDQKDAADEETLPTYRDETMPYIVIVIDELADLMALAAADVEALIVRLAQMARATGIHLVLATQRPSVNVITGVIKANIPARLAFSVASQVDSRTILDQSGAEKLLGKGDMLFGSPEFIKPKRIQGVFMDEKETKAVTDYLRSARPPQYNDEILSQPVKLGGGRGGMDDFGEPDDDLFNEAAETVIRSGKASASLLQRRLRVGYARAARLLDLLEERGVIGPADGARPRDVLVASVSDVGGGDGQDV